MDVFDTPSGMDSAKLIEYITKQFPSELKTLIETKTELAQRQGALTAVADANADREAAKAELAAAKAQAADLLADAKAKNADATAKKKTQDAREAKLNEQEEAYQLSKTSGEESVAAAEKALEAAKIRVTEYEATLNDRAAKLDADRVALEIRIKAFQDKVASISV